MVGESSVKDVIHFINELKRKVKEEGEETIILKSGCIHDEMNYKDRCPTVCSAMRKCMRTTDKTINSPPKGNGRTLEIKYYL